MDDPTSSFPASELKEKHDMSLITDDFWSKESLKDRVFQASDFVLHHTDKKIEFDLYNWTSCTIFTDIYDLLIFKGDIDTK